MYVCEISLFFCVVIKVRKSKEKIFDKKKYVGKNRRTIANHYFPMQLSVQNAAKRVAHFSKSSHSIKPCKKYD